MIKKPLIILTGPTSVGKTNLSIELALRIGGEIISADSVQVYKGMDIGSAKITREQMRGVTHYLIDIMDPSEAFDITLFCEKAKEALSEIYQKGKLPIIVGGTGFYIQGLLYDIDFTEGDTDIEYKKELEKIASDNPKAVHDMLSEVDPDAAAKIHPNDSKRVIRALVFNKTSGEKISEHNKSQSLNESPYNFAYFVLNDYRDKIYSRINDRVDEMIALGLVDEVKSLQKKGYSLENQSMLGLGYKEILKYLDGEYGLEEATEIIKRDTRHFAKRQITWFKREKDVIWMNRWEYENEEDILNRILGVLSEKQIVL